MNLIYFAYSNDRIWFYNRSRAHPSKVHTPTEASQKRLAYTLEAMFREGKLYVRPGQFSLGAMFDVK